MQKKIIALAIASALTVPAVAMADNNIVVYGQADVSINMNSNELATNSQNTNALSSNQSRIGFKGAEDLGGGLSVLWQAEKGLNIDDGTATTAGKLFDRNTFVGLSSADMGTALFGRHDTPYKMSTRNLDVFADNLDAAGTGADNRAYIFSSHDTRLDNLLAYVSPNMGGLTVAAATEFGAESANASGNKKGTAWSLAGMYNAGGVYGALAYQTIKAGTAGTGDLGAGILGTAAADDEAKAIKLGGGYTMDAFTVNGVVEKTTLTNTGVDTKGTNWQIGGKYALSGTDAVKLAYGKHGETKTPTLSNNDAAKQVSVGYDHDMSKRTTVYALYTKLDRTATAAADPSRLSVGVKHAF